MIILGWDDLSPVWFRIPLLREGVTKEIMQKEVKVSLGNLKIIVNL